MKRDKILSELQVALEDVASINPENVTEDVQLESLGLDELDMVEVLVILEGSLGIVIADNAFTPSSTVKEVLDTLQEILQ